MNKTTIQTLLICSILLVGILSFFQMATVLAAEELTNGGFETGDFMGWTTNGSPAVTYGSKRSGSYGCQITMAAGQYNEYVEQTGIDDHGTAIGYINFQNGIGAYWADVFRVRMAPTVGFAFHSNSLYASYGSGDWNISAVTFDQWYKLKITTDGTNIRYYLDGVLKHTNVSSYNMTGLRAGCLIGNPYDGHELWLDDFSFDSGVATYFFEDFENWNANGWTNYSNPHNYPKVLGAAARRLNYGLRAKRESGDGTSCNIVNTPSYTLSNKIGDHNIFTSKFYMRANVTYINDAYYNTAVNFESTGDVIFRVYINNYTGTPYWYVDTYLEHISDDIGVLGYNTTVEPSAAAWHKFRFDYKENATSGIWRVYINDNLIYEFEGDTTSYYGGTQYLDYISLGWYSSAGILAVDFDDFSIINFQSQPPPTFYECTVVSSPEIAADWELDATPYYTPWTDNITTGSKTLEATEITATRDSGLNIYGFSRWQVTNSSGSFNFTTASITVDIQEEHSFTIFYEKSYTIIVTSTPYTTATFTATSYAYTAPKTLTRNNATHTFVCTLFQIDVNSSYRYTFNYWSINGSGSYSNLNIDVAIEGDTNLTMHYLGSWIETPYIPSFTATALNGTWYFRADTHTIHEVLAYRLDIVNTNTGVNDSRTTSGTYTIYYGIRVWVIDIFGKMYELSGGTPEAIVSRSADAEGIQSTTFSCPEVKTLIDAIQINLYQRFGSESWSLRRYFISDENLYIKLPASSWTIYYYTNRTVASTTAYFFHGSSTYNSRLDFIYYRASPWDIAMARLQDQNFIGFLFTPWTYYLGDIFWSFLLLFGIVTAYNRYGSLKPIIALLWLFGGVGSVLSAMIPVIALSVAWLMLAVAMGMTFFKLIYR